MEGPRQEGYGDPFAMTADPEFYLGRRASERALAALTPQVLQTAGPTALTGPPGLGKTLLLRVLARRQAERARFVHLPYSALPPEGLAAWALTELGRDRVENPEAELLRLAAAEQEEGRALVLMIDDAGHLPLPTARGLVDLCAETRSALRLLVAATDGVRTGAVLAALGPTLVEVRLSHPMNPGETVSYVRHRLHRAGLGAPEHARFARAEMERLHRESGGVPRALHQLASQLLRAPDADDPADPAPAAAKSTEPPDLANDGSVGP